MGNFFKGIGKGLFNIVIIPFFFIGLALSAVAGLGVFVLEFFKKIGKFFTGKPLSTDLPEDLQAKAMINGTAQKAEEKKIEIVQAEIADPIAQYREMAKQCATAKAVGNNEDVDMILDDVPFEFDVKLERDNDGEKDNDAPAPSVENPKPEDGVIETYEPKRSKF